MMIGRRTLMATTAGALPQSARGATHDVIVVGAGLAGLNAALHLEAGDAHVTVLEAGPRVGGRVRTRRDLEGAPEGGVHQVHDGYRRTQAWIAELGVALYRRPKPAHGVAFNIGGATIRPADWPTSAVNKLVGDERAFPPTTLRFHILSRINPLKDLDAWRRPENLRYDVPFMALARTLGVSDEALRIMELHATAMGLDAVSALHLFRRQRQSETLEFGGTAKYFERGASALPEAMAAALSADVRLGHRVVAIAQSKDGVTVRCEGGAALSAQFVLCAAPFPALADIAFDPAPTGALGAAIRELPLVHASYIHLIAREPFWLADGFPPNMFTDSPLRLVSKLYDEPGYRDTPALTVELRGPGCAAFDALSDAERREAVLAELARLRPASEGKVDYLGTDAWALNPLFKGGYHYFKPGQVGRFAANLFDPFDRIHFAGEHLAQTEVGVEAAMESGEREALTILRR
jgi:monoamine oxidase